VIPDIFNTHTLSNVNYNYSLRKVVNQ